MKNLIIALLFSLIMIGSDYFITDNFSLLSSLLFSAFIIFITFYIKYFKHIYLYLIILSTLHYLFFNYFHRQISFSDIYLFFTHIEESLETAIALPSLFAHTAITLFIGSIFILIIFKIRVNIYPLNNYLKYTLLLFLIVVNLNTNMGLKLLLSSLNFSSNKNLSLNSKESPLYPERSVDLNIVLIVGESMKYDSYVESKLKKQNFFYKKIYSGATNTDVSLPLLFNIKNNPLELNNHNETNLFKLAKKNNFTTTFCSIQTEKSFQYIKPYLQVEQIDHYKTFSKEERKPLFDFLLLHELDKIDFNKNNFIVFEQIGEHSPYHYFQEKKENTIEKNYKKSIDYSFKLYAKIYQKLIESNKPFVFIYTSDHGEFTGEHGQYGHNKFDPVIYEVPFFITSNTNIPTTYKNINSHYHLAYYIFNLLGYNSKLNPMKNIHIINGTMISREDGFIEIKN
jgi:hypothetical protein